uniref:Uncharacterized protein n=1 Tax=Melanopsichium pennsylvanicum 4 TaxID=1398559 RepID=A0A077R261_9BASI|nr:uncharacterized protein BN887_01371 [Melanopsichium pennsylvanicum 4]
MYTFVILTDPVPPPSSIPPRNSQGYIIGNASAALSGRSSFGTGGGIPGTGGMSLNGVLLQIYRGPWVDNVVKNPLLSTLEREQRVVEPDEDDGEVKLIRENRLDRMYGIDTDAFREGLQKAVSMAARIDADQTILTLPSGYRRSQSYSRISSPHPHHSRNILRSGAGHLIMGFKH